MFFYRQNMYSIPFDQVEFKKHTRKKHAMSYTFGPHSVKKGEYIVYGGDGRVVTQDPTKIPAPLLDTPKWLIADWILANADGQPLPVQAKVFLQSHTLSPGLQWLKQYCHEI